MNPPSAPEPARPPDAGGTNGGADGPGVPGLRTWRSVYLFVLGSFIAWVGLLALLTRMFS
jgi:hypothetical protein